MKRYWLSMVLLQTISLYSQEEMEYAGDPSLVDSRYAERMEEAAEIEHEEAERANIRAQKAFFQEHRYVPHEAAQYTDPIQPEVYDPSMVDVHVSRLKAVDRDIPVDLRADEAREVYSADRSSDALSSLLDHDVVIPRTTRMQDAINDVIRELRVELGPNLSPEEIEEVQRMVRNVATYVHGEVGNIFNEELFKKSMKKLYKSIGKAIAAAHADKGKDRGRHFKKKLKHDADQEKKAIVEQMRFERLQGVIDSK